MNDTKAKLLWRLDDYRCVLTAQGVYLFEMTRGHDALGTEIWVALPQSRMPDVLEQLTAAYLTKGVKP